MDVISMNHQFPFKHIYGPPIPNPIATFVPNKVLLPIFSFNLFPASYNFKLDLCDIYDMYCIYLAFEKAF